MPQSCQADHESVDIESWSFDAAADIVPAHLDARSMERKVLLGCTFVGMIGVVILLVVVSGSTPDIGTAALLQG